jgi:hypothetical protein
LKLQYFDIITGQPPDIMHDMLEGTIPLNFFHLMTRFRKDNVMSVVQLNKALKNFDYGKTILEDGRVPSDLFNLLSYKSPSGLK